MLENFQACFMKHFEIFTTEKSKKVVKTFEKTLGMFFNFFLVSKMKKKSWQNQAIVVQNEAKIGIHIAIQFQLILSLLKYALLEWDWK